MDSVVWVTQGVLLDVTVVSQGITRYEFHLETVTASAGVVATVLRDTSPVQVQLTAQDGTWPTNVEVHLEFTCSGDNGAVRYQVGLRLDTSMPASSGDVTYERITDEADAGA